MNTYSGNVMIMSQKELEDALDDLAGRWRGNPHLSNDYGEGVRYGEIRDALKARFGVSKYIKAVDGPTDYRSVSE